MPETVFRRAERVGQLIQQELASLLVNGVTDTRIGFVTVTEVRLSDDLRSARVYVSVYGTSEQRQEALHGLRDAAGFLRREVGRRVKMKFTPTLTFELDTTLDHAERLEALLHHAPPDGDPTPAVPAPVVNSRTEMAAQKQEFEQRAAERARQQQQQQPNRGGRGGQRKRRGRSGR
jgi:ribosome-binding factor A